jgi:hypothetical protein
MRGVNPASLAPKTMENPNHNSTQGTPRIDFSAVLGHSSELDFVDLDIARAFMPVDRRYVPSVPASLQLARNIKRSVNSWSVQICQICHNRTNHRRSREHDIQPEHTNRELGLRIFQALEGRNQISSASRL